ncbi:MAG: MFS transporter [Bacteroidales bacterium]|nr:MFS transporter [Bacteroidales bacterium]
MNLRKFPATFWIANTMELFERWAYYGMFAILSVYLTDPVSRGGLGFTQEQRGVMQAVVTGILYLLPILGGAIADRFGFRKVLLAAFTTLVAGYYAMGHTGSYGAVFSAFLVVAIGGSLFKPVIVATVSKTSPRGRDTIGFGIFYMIVNIGGFIGPFTTSKLRDLEWVHVFHMCAGVILINLLLLLFFREPDSKRSKMNDSVKHALKQVIGNSLIVIGDRKFMTFLLIMSGFWTMYMQIFFTLPVYITQWVDTTAVYNSSGLLAMIIGTVEDGRGIIRPEMILNIPAFTIICFQVVISGMVRRISPPVSILMGIVVVAAGLGICTLGMSGWIIITGVVTVAFGEMVSSPRIQEYSGRIAPRDKVALYMGYSFLPLALGNILGGLLSGKLYAVLSDKYAFAEKLLLGKGLTARGLDPSTLLEKACEGFGTDITGLTGLMYHAYQPYRIWYVFAAIGLITAISLFAFNNNLGGKKEVNPPDSAPSQG